MCVLVCLCVRIVRTHFTPFHRSPESFWTRNLQGILLYSQFISLSLARLHGRLTFYFYCGVRTFHRSLDCDYILLLLFAVEVFFIGSTFFVPLHFQQSVAYCSRFWIYLTVFVVVVAAAAYNWINTNNQFDGNIATNCVKCTNHRSMLIELHAFLFCLCFARTLCTALMKT